MSTLRFSAEAATRNVGEVLPLDAMPGADGRVGLTVAEPVGVVAAIPAFNFPLLIAAHKLGPAIGAGCPVVIKPPEQTPLAILALATEAIAAGWPAAALSVLPGPAGVAQALTEDDRVALISFTGSSAVGRMVARQAGLKRLMLELGSNAATIVLADARPRPRGRPLRRRRLLGRGPVVHLRAARLRGSASATPSCSSASPRASARCGTATRGSRRPTSAPSSTTRRPSASRP